MNRACCMPKSSSLRSNLLGWTSSWIQKQATIDFHATNWTNKFAKPNSVFFLNTELICFPWSSAATTLLNVLFLLICWMRQFFFVIGCPWSFKPSNNHKRPSDCRTTSLPVRLFVVKAEALCDDSKKDMKRTHSNIFEGLCLFFEWKAFLAQKYPHIWSPQKISWTSNLKKTTVKLIKQPPSIKKKKENYILALLFSQTHQSFFFFLLFFFVVLWLGAHTQFLQLFPNLIVICLTFLSDSSQKSQLFRTCWRSSASSCLVTICSGCFKPTTRSKLKKHWYPSDLLFRPVMSEQGSGVTTMSEQRFLFHKRTIHLFLWGLQLWNSESTINEWLQHTCEGKWDSWFSVWRKLSLKIQKKRKSNPIKIVCCWSWPNLSSFVCVKRNNSKSKRHSFLYHMSRFWLSGVKTALNIDKFENMLKECYG